MKEGFCFPQAWAGAGGCTQQFLCPSQRFPSWPHSPVPLCRGCHKRCCMGTTVTIATAPGGTSASVPAAGRDQCQPQPPHAHGALSGWPRALVPAAAGACPTHQHCYKSSVIGAKQHSLTPGASGHSHSCWGCCCLSTQIFAREVSVGSLSGMLPAQHLSSKPSTAESPKGQTAGSIQVENLALRDSWERG